MEIITKSEKETAALAKKLAKNAKKGWLILLIGDLGSGKTVFTKHFVKALKIKGEVLSPTFILERIYENKKFTVNHYDLYMIKNENALDDLEINENLDRGHICIVEWPEIAENILPKQRTVIKIEKLSETERKFLIEDEKWNC